MTGLGKIYKITCNDTGDVYYGSTKKHLLSTRKAEHKADVKRYDEGKKPRKCACYDIVKNNNFKIEIVEEAPLENLKQREKYYIENFKCININNPLPTKEEAQKKKWETEKIRRQHPDVKAKHLQSYKDWYNKTGGRKEYQDEYNKEYREKNSEIVECECGSCVKKCRFKEHLKTKKHLEFNKKK
jgi:hypothetical protein